MNTQDIIDHIGIGTIFGGGIGVIISFILSISAGISKVYIAPIILATIVAYILALLLSDWMLKKLDPPMGPS